MYTIITRHPNSDQVQAIQVGAAAFETSSDTFRSEERESFAQLRPRTDVSARDLCVRRKSEGAVVISKRERT